MTHHIALPSPHICVYVVIINRLKNQSSKCVIVEIYHVVFGSAMQDAMMDSLENRFRLSVVINITFYI